MPTDADRLLLRASDRIDDAVLAQFSLDTQSGLPTDLTIARTLADATCAQVEFWLEVGEGHDIDGIRGPMQVVGGGSYQAPPDLAPRARSILKRANLMDIGWVGV